MLNERRAACAFLPRLLTPGATDVGALALQRALPDCPTLQTLTYAAPGPQRLPFFAAD